MTTTTARRNTFILAIIVALLALAVPQAAAQTEPAEGEPCDGQDVGTLQTGADGIVYECISDPTDPESYVWAATEEEETSTGQDLFVRTEAGTPVTIDIVAEISDNDTDPLTLTSLSDPANGTTEIVDGQAVYTPSEGFIGEDTFTYEAADDLGATTSGTVTVEVSVLSDGEENLDDLADTGTSTLPGLLAGLVALTAAAVLLARRQRAA